MNNQCEYGYLDCVNLGEKCYLCSVKGLHYKQPKIVKTSINKSAPKITKRKGSEFEYRNNRQNNDLLNGTTSRQTPNSGAGQIKGDEEIVGIINIMEELKEQNKISSRGIKTFTIQKEWLEKLKSEASAANKEFWYLKFIFNCNDQDTYVILDSDMVMSMVYTMVEDRRSKELIKQEKVILQREIDLIKAQNILLVAEKALLEEKLEYEYLKNDKSGIKSKINDSRRTDT